MTEFRDGSLYFHLNWEKQIIVSLGSLGVEGITRDRKNFSFNIPIKSLESQKIGQSEKKYLGQGNDLDSGLDWRVEFIMPADRLIIQWKFSIYNNSCIPVLIHKITLMDQSDSTRRNLFLNQPAINENLSFYSNGWQSWSSTGSYHAQEKMRTTRLGILQEPMIINPGTSIYRKHSRFSSDFFSVIVDKQSRCGLLLGFLSQREHFGSITADLRKSPIIKMWANGDDARLEPGQSMETDWAAMYPFDLTSEDPLKDYLDDVTAEHQISNLPKPLEGWCSWYHYYQSISQNVIKENLEKLYELKYRLPLHLIQIDDGFQAEVGDWLEFNERFSNGLTPLTEDIKNDGFSPGLWLAPFILHPRAKTVHNHPEWLLRNRMGSLVRTGFVWNSLGAALDLTHPGALNYVREVIGTAVHQWGFPYLKLDFLYAAALKGKYQDDRKTRAQVLRLGMEAIREAAGENTMLVGCGAPLGSMLGLVDIMRIGPDVNPTWVPSFSGISKPFENEPSMPSVRNSIQNIITRSPLHNRWWVNDPDCLLLRPDSKLTLPEIQSLATAIAMTGGSILVSDDMTQLPLERLRILATLLPVMNKRPIVMDLFDSQRPSKLRLDLEGTVGKWHLLACFNWEDYESETELVLDHFDLPNGDYHFRSFWDDRISQLQRGNIIFSGKIPAHGVLLLAARMVGNSPTVYLGSDLHISQGLEITFWEVKKNHLKFDIQSGKKLSGKADVLIEAAPSKITIDGEPSTWEMIGNCICRILIPDKDHSSITIM